MSTTQVMAGVTQSTSRVEDARCRWISRLDPVPLHVLLRYDVTNADQLERVVDDLEPGAAWVRRDR